MERKNEQEQSEFARIRKQIQEGRDKGVQPTQEQVNRLRELDDWLARNTDYWKRRYRKEN